MVGRFEGELSTRWLDDGRQMQLIQPFAFYDAEGGEWRVPEGAQTDGASIPRALWTLIGGPFEGPYRKPAVVHDWFCDVRNRDWRAVHRMFHSGMICAGVAPTKAKVLYLGVLIGGPRWSLQAIHNSRVAYDRCHGDGNRMYLRNMDDWNNCSIGFEITEDDVGPIEELAMKTSIGKFEIVANKERERLFMEKFGHLVR